jgi:hypothetical protein
MTTRTLSLVSVLTLLILPCAAHAAERKIDRSQLPAAVEKTVQAQSQGAVVKGFSTDVENGQRVYEAELLVNGRSRDIEIAPDGTLNEFEEEVSFESLPPSVQSALTAKAGSAKITKVESLSKKGTLVAYEAATLKGSKKSEIQVGPNGEKLSHSE